MYVFTITYGHVQTILTTQTISVTLLLCPSHTCVRVLSIYGSAILDLACSSLLAINVKLYFSPTYIRRNRLAMTPTIPIPNRMIVGGWPMDRISSEWKMTEKICNPCTIVKKATYKETGPIMTWAHEGTIQRFQGVVISPFFVCSSWRCLIKWWTYPRIDWAVYKCEKIHCHGKNQKSGEKWEPNVTTHETNDRI